jgi:hypothetical protein
MRAVMESSSTPVLRPPCMDSGMRPKKCPTPMRAPGSARPFPAQALQASQMASITMRRREMRVRSRGARRFVFLVGEQFLYLAAVSSIPAADSGSKTFAMAPQPAVAGEHGFFLVGGVAVFGFELFQRADGGDIVAGLSCRPPCPIRCASVIRKSREGIGWGHDTTGSGCATYSSHRCRDFKRVVEWVRHGHLHLLRRFPHLSAFQCGLVC